MFGLRNYLAALRHWRFGLTWVGLTISAVGDGMTRLALIWLTYNLKSSAVDIGLLLTAYSAPVIVGGPLAGYLLDRFGARKAMLADNLIRSVVVGAVPVLFHLGRLEPWHLYAVAAVFGFMKMISLAGAPTLMPALLPAADLNAGNALEMLSFSLSSIVGPALAGILLGTLTGADLLALDAASYFLLVTCLLAIGRVAEGHRARERRPGSGFLPALRLSAANPFLRNTTLAYMLLNIGMGIIGVLVPVLILRVPGAGGGTLGLILSAEAVGELTGSFLSGAMGRHLPYTRLIAVSLTLGGVPLLLLALKPEAAVMGLALGLAAMIQAPLTVWAQTVRMRLIPADVRGSVFALLRTVMQAGPALGGLLGAQAVGRLPGPAVAITAFVLVSGPGLASLLAPALLETRLPPEEAA